MFAQCVRCSLPAGEDFAFAEQVRPLRDAAPPSTRWVFATATLPEQVFMDLEEVGGAGASEMVVGVEGVHMRVLGGRPVWPLVLHQLVMASNHQA